MKAITPSKTKGSSIKEYIRFGIVGVVNTGTDFLALNTLLALDRSTDHASFILYKIISFSIAVAQSYLLNKHWVFSTNKNKKGPGIANLGEGGRFFAISSLGAIVNVTSASLVFAVLASAGVDEKLSANLGAMTGTMLVLFWNFFGYKYFVFKRTKNI